MTDDDTRNAETLPPPATERTDEETGPGSRPPRDIDMAAAVVRGLLRPELQQWADIRNEWGLFLKAQRERDEEQARLVAHITKQVDRILERDAEEAQAHREAHQALQLARQNERRLGSIEAKLQDVGRDHR